MFKTSKLIDLTTIRVGEGRISYPHLFTPEASPLNPDKKYSLEFLIPKTNLAAIKVIKDAIENAVKAGSEKYWDNKRPAKLNTDIIKDGDTKVDKNCVPLEETKGCWVIKASSNEHREPAVYDDSTGSGRIALTESDEEKIYGGCWGWLIGSVAPYDTPAQKGVKIYLNGFVKSRDDDPFGAGARAVSEALSDDDDYEDDEALLSDNDDDLPW